MEVHKTFPMFVVYLKTKIMEERYLNFHEFFDEIWMLIPETLISDKYIDENIEMFKDLLFFYYKEYAEDRITLNLCAKLIENTFQYLFKHKPLLCNAIDDFIVNRN